MKVMLTTRDDDRAKRRASWQCDGKSVHATSRGRYLRLPGGPPGRLQDYLAFLPDFIAIPQDSVNRMVNVPKLKLNNGNEIPQIGCAFFLALVR